MCIYFEKYCQYCYINGTIYIILNEQILLYFGKYFTVNKQIILNKTYKRPLFFHIKNSIPNLSFYFVPFIKLLNNFLYFTFLFSFITFDDSNIPRDREPRKCLPFFQCGYTQTHKLTNFYSLNL